MTLETELLAEMPVKPPPRRIGSTQDARQPIVAIIGAGFSGTMAAIHLRHILPADHVIYLFDRTGRFARGPAYAASDTPHLLNVRSLNMSAFPDDPGHFERWLSQQDAQLAKETVSTEAGLFATRRLYGRYLRALLYQEIGASGGRVRLGADDVVGVRRMADGWALHCSSGRAVVASGIVLAVGNLPSKQVCDGVIYHDPWAYGATAGLRPDEPVLIVGTGLTMIDLALGMRARGFAGPIIALSRRGLVPQRHAEAGPAWPCPDFTPAERASLPRLVRRLRVEIALAARQKIGWRSVIDGLRPATAALWRGLPEAERNRFLRHLRPHWDSHRHRLAPASAAEFDALVAEGGLIIKRGRVQAIEVHGDLARVSVQDRRAGRSEALTVQRVIYATGVGAGTTGDGFVAGLVQAGHARIDRHGMGLEVTDALEIIGEDDRTTPRAWALGPIVRGVFWECTAVPDIRVQARMIAAEVARQLAVTEVASGLRA
jgi:uncharacterized NAD(P)/FAD-binding protein YdhS